MSLEKQQRNLAESVTRQIAYMKRLDEMIAKAVLADMTNLGEHHTQARLQQAHAYTGHSKRCTENTCHPSQVLDSSAPDTAPDCAELDEDARERELLEAERKLIARFDGELDKTAPSAYYLRGTGYDLPARWREWSDARDKFVQTFTDESKEAMVKAVTHDNPPLKSDVVRPNGHRKSCTCKRCGTPDQRREIRRQGRAMGVRTPLVMVVFWWIMGLAAALEVVLGLVTHSVF